MMELMERQQQAGQTLRPEDLQSPLEAIALATGPVQKKDYRRRVFVLQDGISTSPSAKRRVNPFGGGQPLA